VLAPSGGRTPWIMLRALAAEDVPWSAVHIVQVDERRAGGRPDRNLTHIPETLIDQAPVRRENLHPMPVESSLADAAREYAGTEYCIKAGSTIQWINMRSNAWRK
jgi:6-phosphogluconolactonase